MKKKTKSDLTFHALFKSSLLGGESPPPHTTPYYTLGGFLRVSQASPRPVTYSPIVSWFHSPFGGWETLNPSFWCAAVALAVAPLSLLCVTPRLYPRDLRARPRFVLHMLVVNITWGWLPYYVHLLDQSSGCLNYNLTPGWAKGQNVLCIKHVFFILNFLLSAHEVK